MLLAVSPATATYRASGLVLWPSATLPQQFMSAMSRQRTEPADANDPLRSFWLLQADHVRCSTPPSPHVPHAHAAAHDRGEGGAAQRLIRIDYGAAQLGRAVGEKVALPQQPQRRRRK
jgi:hypothetical protein